MHSTLHALNLTRAQLPGKAARDMKKAVLHEVTKYTSPQCIDVSRRDVRMYTSVQRTSGLAGPIKYGAFI